MGSISNEVTHEFRFFRAYKDGRIETLYNTQKIPPSTDPISGVQSKDIVISPLVSARIFLPKIIDSSTTRKLPILFYIHGGGFCLESAFSPMFHNHLTQLTQATNAIAVSVEYGLFPDRPIPACYDDAWAALKWVTSHSTHHGPEAWLNRHADFDRLFLAGDSGGANMCHNLAVRIGSNELQGVEEVAGIVMVHPFFGGLAEDDEMWMFMCPENEGVHDRRLRPSAEDLRRVGCKKVLVFFAEKDHLREVGQWYCDELKRSEWSGILEVVEHMGVAHEFHLISEPHGEKALDLINKFGCFIKQN